MQRTVLLIKPEQYKKLSQRAKKEHVSIAEINRRAIDQFLENEMTAENLNALNLLAESLIASNKRTEKALKKAEQSIDKFLKDEKNNEYA